MAKDAGTEVKPLLGPDGVHMLRTAMSIQYQLSQMADQKANMVLAATFVIFTVTVAQVRAGAPAAPLLILGAAAFMAALLAIFAVLPSVGAPRAGGVANVLFFGSFTQLPEAEFVDMLVTIAENQRATYEAIAHDIYQNGRVLAHKKYRYLGYAYRILLVGLVASFLTFIAPFAIGLFRL
jgi:hypothetical protein